MPAYAQDPNPYFAELLRGEHDRQLAPEMRSPRDIKRAMIQEPRTIGWAMDAEKQIGVALADIAKSGVRVENATTTCRTTICEIRFDAIKSGNIDQRDFAVLLNQQVNRHLGAVATALDKEAALAFSDLDAENGTAAMIFLYGEQAS